MKKSIIQNIIFACLFLISTSIGFAQQNKFQIEDQNKNDLEIIITHYENLLNKNEHENAGKYLINEVGKNPNSISLNYLIGKYYEDIGFYKYPYMTRFFINYLKLTNYDGLHTDEVIHSLVEYYLSLSIKNNDERIVNVDDVSGNPSSINVRVLLSKLKSKEDKSLLLYNGLLDLINKDYVSAVNKLDAAPLDKISYKNFRWAFNNMGYALLKDNKLQEAERALKIAIIVDPGNKYAHVNLGFVLFNQEKYKDALAEYETALEIDPNYQKAKDGKSSSEYRLKLIKKATPSISSSK